MNFEEKYKFLTIVNNAYLLEVERNYLGYFGIPIYTRSRTFKGYDSFSYLSQQHLANIEIFVAAKHYETAHSLIDNEDFKAFSVKSEDFFMEDEWNLYNYNDQNPNYH